MVKRRKLKEELRSFWFIPLRLSIFLLLFGAAFLARGNQEAVFWPFLCYSLATLVFLFAIEVDARFFRPGFLQFMIFVHFVFELIAEGAILSKSTALTSQYSILFLLTIVSASLAYKLAGTLTIATLASITYAFTSSFNEVFESLDTVTLETLKQALQTNDEVFYAIFLHVCTFYLIAFISGFLAQKLRAKEGELSQASQVLERVQLDTDEILLNLHSGLITIDSIGRVVYFNRAAEAILGYRQSEVRGRHFLDIFNDQMPDFCEQVLSVLKDAKPNIRTEVEIMTPAGEVLPLGLTASVLGDQRIGVRGVVAIFQDLTQAKEMENALIKADRLAAVGELSARIAHEIRNPLASISGSVEVLRKEIEVGGDNARLMELIVKESERLSRVLNDFLNYARQRPERSDKVELVSLLSEVTELLKNSINMPAKVELHLHTPASTEYVVGDEDQIKQIINNLVTNAIEAANPETGQVNVSICENPDDERHPASRWVEIQVTDDGAGFGEDVRRRLFEPFFSRKKGGTGLGLAIVKRCVDNVRGEIEVESASGAGTRFRVYLRRYQASRSEAEEEPQTSQAVETP